MQVWTDSCRAIFATLSTLVRVVRLSSSMSLSDRKYLPSAQFQID
jgi:hypothetical protein